MGVAQLPTALVQPDLDSGQVVSVVPDWQPRTAVVHAVFHSRGGLLPAVRALLDFLARDFAEYPA